MKPLTALHGAPPGPSLDHLLPDALTPGDVVHVDGVAHAFLYKREGAGGLVFGLRASPSVTRELTATQYLEGVAAGRVEPERDDPLPPSRTREQDSEAAFAAFSPGSRARSDSRAIYVAAFRKRARDARERGSRFPKSDGNAQSVFDEMNAALAAAGVPPMKAHTTRSMLRWLKLADTVPDPAIAFLHGNAKRPHPRRAPTRLLEEVAAQIRICVAVAPHFPPSKIWSLVKDRVKEIKLEEGIKLPLPTRKLVEREYNRYDAWIRKAQIDGLAAADLEFGAVGKKVRPGRLLDEVELDHHVVDLVNVLGAFPGGEVISNIGLGRMWFTFAFDVASGYPLGFHGSFEGTGLLPALACVAHAVAAKTYVAERFPWIEGSWLAHGKPVLIRWDNAREFIGLQMAAALARVGIGFETARPFRGDDKAYVERFHGSFERDLVGWLKGATGASPKARGERDPVAEARVAVDDFIALVHQYIITVYARRPQEGLDWETPEDRWVRLAKQHPPRPLRPDELARHDVLASFEFDAYATRDGVRWRNLFFQSPGLQHARRHSGAHGYVKEAPTPVRVRVPMRNLGVAYITVPGSGSAVEIEARCTNPHAQGLTSWQHDVVQKYLQNRKRDATNSDQYGHAVAALFRTACAFMGVDVAGEGTKSTKARSGAIAARFAGVAAAGPQEHALEGLAGKLARYDVLAEIAGIAVSTHPDTGPPPGGERPPATGSTADDDPLLEPGDDPEKAVRYPEAPAEPEWGVDPIEDHG